MASIIDELKRHEASRLQSYYDLSDKASKRFLKDIVAYSKTNGEELKQFCRNTLPSEFSSLSIVYEALSEYSFDWNSFFLEEIRRVINLAKQKRIKPSVMEVLTDIETEDIYLKDEAIYIEMIDFMISNLHPDNDKSFNIELLDVIDWFLIEYDEDEDDFPQLPQWTSRLRHLADNSGTKVTAAVNEVLETLGVSTESSSTSFIGKIGKLFR